MAALTILDLPEELIRAVLNECRTWSHPCVKNKDAVPIDFVPYSDFHLKFDHAKYLSVLLTCKTFYRIAAPLAYDCVSLLNPTFNVQKTYMPFPEYYRLLPRRENFLFHSSIALNYGIFICHLLGQVEMSRTEIRFRSRPEMAQKCRALRIDPRIPVNPCQNVVLPDVYTETMSKEFTLVRSLDYVLASPSGLFESYMVDWRSNCLVQRQLRFFQNAVTYHQQLKRLRLDLVRDRLCQSIWDDLVKGIAQFKDLGILSISHMRSPSEQTGSAFADEVLQSPKHTGQFEKLILTDYGRCFQTLDSLIQWPRKLEHLTLMLRLSPESLYLNELNMNTSSVTTQLIDKLLIILSRHKATLQTLQLGAALTPRAFSVAYENGISPESPLSLNHNVMPDFQGFLRLEHLHISSVFAGHMGFCERWDSIRTNKERKERLQEFDRLLPPNLTRITLDIGCEFTLRHCPCFPQDDSAQPICTLVCPLNLDVQVFLTKLAERAQSARVKGTGKLQRIHVNYCVRPFALAMPVEDLPEGFNWGWVPPWTFFDPWNSLKEIKKAVKKHGILFTYTGLEPVCGKPRTHLPKPVLTEEDATQDMEVVLSEDTSQEVVSLEDETQETWNRMMREYYLRAFNYEDEMCSEHVWTRVMSG